MRFFFDHVDIVSEDECLRWSGKKDKGGYGVLGRRIDGKLKMFQAHRYLYEQTEGKIQEGMFMDHICRVRCCVNPYHLRVVTPKISVYENNNSPVAKNAKKTHCHKGHEYTVDNLLYEKRGERRCKKCRTNWWSERRELDRILGNGRV
jgi:hypothetical protein